MHMLSRLWYWTLKYQVQRQLRLAFLFWICHSQRRSMCQLLTVSCTLILIVGYCEIINRYRTAFKICACTLIKKHGSQLLGSSMRIGLLWWPVVKNTWLLFRPLHGPFYRPQNEVQSFVWIYDHWFKKNKGTKKEIPEVLHRKLQ